MNKFRVSRYDDCYSSGDTNTIVCLKCKKDFVFNCSDPIFCPMCGIKFDGKFDHKNPRYYRWPQYFDAPYKEDSKTKEIIYAERPRLVIECIKTMREKLHPYLFAATPCEPYNVLTVAFNQETQRSDSGIPCSIRCMKNYLYLVNNKTYDYIRISYIKGKNKKTIKEWHV